VLVVGACGLALGLTAGIWTAATTLPKPITAVWAWPWVRTSGWATASVLNTREHGAFGSGQIQRKVANNLTKSRFADLGTAKLSIFTSHLKKLV